MQTAELCPEGRLDCVSGTRGAITRIDAPLTTRNHRRPISKSRPRTPLFAGIALACLAIASGFAVYNNPGSAKVDVAAAVAPQPVAALPHFACSPR